jgi:hypothetical protein
VVVTVIKAGVTDTTSPFTADGFRPPEGVCAAASPKSAEISAAKVIILKRIFLF